MVRAVVCRRLGSPEEMAIEDVRPAPMGPGQARIAIRAAGLNFPDVLMVAGQYQHKPALPFVPGMEAAGVVVACDPASGVAVGDRVMAALRSGGFSGEAVVDGDALLPMPDAMDFASGAAFRVATATAHNALVERAGLRAGEVLLVHGAGGGVGLAAVDLGHRLGATVIAVASSEAKRAAARKQGADHVLGGEGEPFQEAVKRISGGADVVFDPVGGAVLEASLRCLRWGARICVVGFAGGAAGLLRSNLVLIKGASVLGIRAGEWGRHDPAAAARQRAALIRLAEEGMRPVVSARLPLEGFVEAMRMLSDRRAVGRVVLEVG